MKMRRIKLESGFTLIEVIITLVVIGIVAAMMAAYFGTSITQSSAPVSRLKAVEKLNAIMEKITADYNNAIATWSPNTTYTLNTIILPTASKKNWYQYVCVYAGTSGSTEPEWLTTSEVITDSTVKWKYSGTMLPLKSWAENTNYTEYAIIYPNNGYQYLCIVAGTSGSTEPTWPTTIDATVTETTGSTPKVAWKCGGFQPLLALQTRIGNEGSEYSNKTFGGDTQVKYRVIHNRFITFVDNTERSTPVVTGEADYGKYLKVTISLHSTESPRTDEKLTTLFVRR